MSKITLTHEGTKYTLEFSRSTAAHIERQGFRLEEVDKQPVVMVPLLIQGAFLMHHRGLNALFIDNIFDAVPNKRALIQALMELYSEVALSFFDEQEAAEGDGKNATWAVE